MFIRHVVTLQVIFMRNVPFTPVPSQQVIKYKCKQTHNLHREEETVINVHRTEVLKAGIKLRQALF